MKVNPLDVEARHQRRRHSSRREHRAYESEPDDAMPAKQFIMGWDTNGRLLELAITPSTVGTK
ncbi:hypothetical protein AAEX63_05020 [Luteococcus sp. H138]|uniref:hypothetical protein n=1 Tax=unclassified Luteococcus TaxID=2639923 RepID=UPI00313C8DAA